MHMYATHMSLVSTEGIGCPWDWSYRELRATTWVLGTKPRPSAEAESALNH